MLPKSAVTIVTDSTVVAGASVSSNEPASQTNDYAQPGADDRLDWVWIHRCDAVISDLPIGLT